MALNKTLRYIILGGIFVLPFLVFPLFVVGGEFLGIKIPGTFFPYITGKNFAFRIIVEIILAAWMILVLRDPAYRPRRSWILLSLTAFITILGIATIFGEDPYRSFWSNYERMEGLIGFLHLGAYFLVTATVLNARRLWDWWLSLSMGGAVFVGFYAFLQIGQALAISQGGVRVDATLGNATYLAAYMLFHAFIALWFLLRPAFSRTLALTSILVGATSAAIYVLRLYTTIPDGVEAPTALGWVLLSAILVDVAALLYWYLFREAEKLMRVLFYGLPLILFLTLTLLPATRGAFVGLVAGLFVFAAILIYRSPGRVRTYAAGGLLALVIVVGGFWLARNSSFVQGSPALSRLTKISLEEAAPRFTVWKMSFEGFKERPILGWGPENYSIVFDKYYDPSLHSQEQWFDRAHNVFFDQLITGGIFGLLFYLTLFFFGVWYLWKIPGDRLSALEKAVLTGMLAAYFVQNLFVFDNLTSYILFLMALGFIHRETVRTNVSVTTPRLVPAGLQYGISAAVLVLLLGGLYYFNARPIAANTLISSGIMVDQDWRPATALADFKKAIALNTFGTREVREQLVSMSGQVGAAPQIDEATKIAFRDTAGSEIEKETKRSEHMTRIHLIHASFLRNFGFYAEALAAAEKAQALSPRKQGIMFERLIDLIRLERFSEAREVAREAFELAPEYDEARRMYAIAAIYDGDLPFADSLLLERYGTNLYFHPELVLAYAQTGNHNRAVQVWHEELKKNPNNFQGWLSLTAHYLELNMRAEAIAALEEAVRVNPAFRQNADALIAEIRAGRNP